MLLPIFPYFSMFGFFHNVGTNSPLIGLFTEKIIRIKKMVKFSALSNRFNHTKIAHSFPLLTPWLGQEAIVFIRHHHSD